MPRPVIGITTYAARDDGRVELPREYADAIRRAGGLPVLVPPGDGQPVEVLDHVDGVILAGGGDIGPGSFAAGRDHESVYGTSTERDDSELRLAAVLADRDVPLLAICRGMQVLNVALGGTLHPHLPDVVGEAVLHRAPPREPTPHAVELEPGSALAELMGAVRVDTMSWHHQAADRLAERLRPVGWAPDGVVEAAELAGHRWAHAVQWHPELTAAADPAQQALFDGLVAAASVG